MSFITITPPHPPSGRKTWYLARRGIGPDNFFIVAQFYNEDMCRRAAAALMQHPLEQEPSETKIVSGRFKKVG